MELVHLTYDVVYCYLCLGTRKPEYRAEVLGFYLSAATRRPAADGLLEGFKAVSTTSLVGSEKLPTTGVLSRATVCNIVQTILCSRLRSGYSSSKSACGLIHTLEFLKGPSFCSFP